MLGKMITPSQKETKILVNPIILIICITIMLAVLVGCGAPPAITQSPVTSAPATTTQPPASSAPATATIAPATPLAALAKPQGELIVALQMFGNESWLPWLDPSMPNLHDIVYDMLIYWDVINRKFIPGLAESWEVSPDGLTLTYHLRKGVQYTEGWGELTSADVKYNFEMHASKYSVGKTSQTRRIASMDTPDPYTLVVHFKDPYPTFFVDLSMGNSAVCQGIVCKKYLETVGEEAAAQKPIGSGPYKMVDFKSGDYFKFEANEDCWRVVPEFKTMTVRLISEIATLSAALKNKEVDLSQITSQQMADLKASGVAVEVSSVGGQIMVTGFGGMIISADKRYDAAYHNKDPWVDSRVRKAMAISIDRAAICKAIYAGYADPVSVPLLATGIEKYQYPYDPAAAKQLLKDAGYPNGFSFRVISSIFQGQQETPHLMEALAGYWQQIGLNPQITSIEYAVYNKNNILKCKTAGDIAIFGVGICADMLMRTDGMMPNGVAASFQDEGSYAIWKETPPNATIAERDAIVTKLNQYYYDNVGPLPLVRVGYCFAWNSEKVAPYAHSDTPQPMYLEYVRHAQPLNTFRLFTPYPGR